MTIYGNKDYENVHSPIRRLAPTHARPFLKPPGYETTARERTLAPGPPLCYNLPNPNPQSLPYPSPHLPNPITPAPATPTRPRLDGPAPGCGIAGDLYDYIARRYDPVLARFIQPDAIVPDPGDPQSLNRYSYSSNNPIRYTDPTGFFSEEQIMNYLGVDNWDAVLAMFEEGGKFAGAWGFLEVLRQAELGDVAGVEKIMHPDEGWWETTKLLFGAFTEENGRLMLQLEGSDAVVAADLIGMIGSNLGQDAIFWLKYHYVTNNKYIHVVDRGVDWVGAGFDVIGLAADAFSAGIGGRFVNGAQAAYRAKRLGTTLSEVSGRLDWISVVRSSTAFANDPNVSTGMDVALDVAPFALDAASIEVPFVFDAASLYLNLREGLYIGP